MILSESSKAQLIADAKGLAYRIGIYAIVMLSSFGIEHLDLLNIPPYATVGIGFILGEINSWAQSRYDIQAQVGKYFAKAKRSVAKAIGR